MSQTERNAFVLPSGNIFVFSGMLDLCKNDDQLAVRREVFWDKDFKGGSQP